MNREIGFWLQGNVDGTRRFLTEILAPLLKTHRIPNSDELVMEAVYSLNRIHSRITDMRGPDVIFPFKPRKPMTQAQKKIHAFISTCWKESNAPPAYSEIAKHMGYSVGGHPYSMVTVMIKNGWLAKVGKTLHARPTPQEEQP